MHLHAIVLDFLRLFLLFHNEYKTTHIDPMKPNPRPAFFVFVLICQTSSQMQFRNKCAKD